MAIPVQSLRDRLSRVLGSGGPSFDIHFLAAINSVITDFNRQCNRSMLYLDDTSGNLMLDATTELSRVHETTFFYGCLFYLERSAEWSKEPSEKTERMFKRCLAMSQFEAINYDNPEAGIPAGKWTQSINQFDPTGLSDINLATGTPTGGEGI